MLNVNDIPHGPRIDQLLNQIDQSMTFVRLKHNSKQSNKTLKRVTNINLYLVDDWIIAEDVTH